MSNKTYSKLECSTSVSNSCRSFHGSVRCRKCTRFYITWKTPYRSPNAFLNHAFKKSANKLTHITVNVSIYFYCIFSCFFIRFTLSSKSRAYDNRDALRMEVSVNKIDKVHIVSTIVQIPIQIIFNIRSKQCRKQSKWETWGKKRVNIGAPC